ncbi:HutD family protein [Mesorhizobium sp. PAMC28654]|uniref:HutD/Ves family protein n=1 Tax=Mesorhizobium sp. PAMC28654 TaxID=2880934 RepID=UPI001D0A93AE|nr:HutD family protein [Mesorhizobium sp. PAMC28654]UDL91258.1 HutD family protein [Mesorhizobium sp. PAMC28654]
MHILRAAEYRSMPWKNGGGVTTEIVVSPAAAGLDDFDWRISMARVENGGPFSQFAGIDRTLAVLEGEGISLDIAGRSPVAVTRAAAPLSFPADAPTAAALIAGPITDLNVMTRRSRMTHAVERLVISAPHEIQADADTTVILSLDGEIKVAGMSPAHLGALDTLLVERNAGKMLIEPAGISTLFVIRIDRVAGNN